MTRLHKQAMDADVKLLAMTEASENSTTQKVAKPFFKIIGKPGPKRIQNNKLKAFKDLREGTLLMSKILNRYHIKAPPLLFLRAIDDENEIHEGQYQYYEGISDLVMDDFLNGSKDRLVSLVKWVEDEELDGEDSANMLEGMRQLVGNADYGIVGANGFNAAFVEDELSEDRSVFLDGDEQDHEATFDHGSEERNEFYSAVPSNSFA
jgi:hypothetical protein